MPAVARWLADCLFLMTQRPLAGCSKTIGRARRQFMQTAVQMLPELVSEMKFVHNVMPLAFSALAKVLVAREQCVLTLPSEQPIADAVSATSISSQ